MNTRARLTVIACVLAAGVYAGWGMAFPPDSRAVRVEAQFACPCIAQQGGTAYLQLSVFAADIAGPRGRPVNLAIVLDRSGSMGEEGKLEHAKAGLNALVDQLGPDDILSIVDYDDVVGVLRPAAHVRDKAGIRRLVACIEPRGCTNLGGGLLEGFHQAERYACDECVNRVVLLSDGLANCGITDPRALGRIARQWRAASISLSTMGVGLDYNENLMVALADNGGGNYYFIEHAEDLASLMRRELDRLACVAVQNAQWSLHLAEGVQVMDVIGSEFQTRGCAVTIPIGDIAAGERREFTIELAIPAGEGSLTAVTGSLRYAAQDGAEAATRSFNAVLHYTRDLAEIDRTRNWDGQAKADVAVSTRTVDNALKELDEGKSEAAAADLGAASQALAASPAASQGGAAGQVIRDQQTRVDSYTGLLKDVRNAGRAKKAIRYFNYKTQKNRE